MKGFHIAEYDERYLPLDTKGHELANAKWVKMPANPRGLAVVQLLLHQALPSPNF